LPPAKETERLGDNTKVRIAELYILKRAKVYILSLTFIVENDIPVMIPDDNLHITMAMFLKGWTKMGFDEIPFFLTCVQTGVPYLLCFRSVLNGDFPRWAPLPLPSPLCTSNNTVPLN
ncbi:hypothetical protein, partial [Cytobacillus firmus]|uniref:hypothetical protein n=1 Tax=Cytobacillus firmus TaxID=1399 RepID=UPI003BA2BDC9